MIVGPKNLRIFFLVLLCLLSFMSSGSFASEPDKDDPTFILMQALNTSDSLSMLEKPDMISETMIEILSDLERARDEFISMSSTPELSDENQMVLYTEFWIVFEKGYYSMIMGSEAKQHGYNALTRKNPDACSDAYDSFSEASLHYADSINKFREATSILKRLDTSIIAVELAQAAIPDEHVLDEIITRLSDNKEICNAYTHLCRSEMLMTGAENITIPEAEAELLMGKEIMQKLSSSPYVGKEAALISNISVFS